MKNNKSSSAGFYDFDLYPLPDWGKIKPLIQGKGQRGVLILYRSVPDQAPEMEKFLASIFNAASVQLSEDTYLLNLFDHKRVLLADFYKEFTLNYIFAFGFSPPELGMQAQMPPYLPVELDQKVYVLADDIQLIHQERQQKGTKLSGALWKAIRQLFKNNP